MMKIIFQEITFVDKIYIIEVFDFQIYKILQMKIERFFIDCKKIMT